MIEKLRNTRKSKKGFTLVELVVVIVIIAILAAALVTSLIGYVSKARATAAEVEAHNVYTAAQAYISENVGLGRLSIATAAGSENNIITLDAAGTSSTATVKIADSIENLSGIAVTVNGTAPTATQHAYISVLTADEHGTITAMTYKATNNYTVQYALATGWDVTAP